MNTKKRARSLKLGLTQRLSENICSVVRSGDVLQSDDSLGNHVPHKGKLNVHVFCAGMMNWILSEGNAGLIVLKQGGQRWWRESKFSEKVGFLGTKGLADEFSLS